MQIPMLAYASGVSVALPVAFGAAKIRSLDKALKILLLLQTLYLMLDVAQFYLALHDTRNLWTSHIYNVVEYGLTMAIFSFWQKNGTVKNVLLGSIAVFFLLWVAASVYLEPFSSPATYSTSLSRMVYCAVGLYTLRTITVESSTSVLRDPRFWIISSLLISSAGDLMFYALRGVIAGLSAGDLLVAFGIHWVLIITTNLLYSLGYLCISPRISGGPSALAQ